MNGGISVVVLTGRGPRHSYFCAELAKHHALRGIVVDDRYHMRDRIWTFLKGNRFQPVRMAEAFDWKRRLAPYERRDRETEEAFFSTGGKSPEFPQGVPVLKSRDPNNADTVRWVRKRAPDVLAVFGTRLIRPPVLSLARLGALNLHTGLSPFYRGGQCTFWCLYHGDLEHVGVTIHHLSERIDGGDIVATARPEIEPADTVRSLECKLVRLGTAKFIDAVWDLREGRANGIPQRERGRLFLSKMYTLKKRFALEKKLDQGWVRELLAKQAAGTVAR